jgi:flagella basal body P-ring formation protein FlgA
MRKLLISASLLAATIVGAHAQSAGDTTVTPTLKPIITVTSDVVRVGDLVDNAGEAASIALYRSPDLGTTGTLSAASVLSALRSRNVIGVDARDVQEITISRAAQTVSMRDAQAMVARVLAGRSGLSDTANIQINFDREIRDIQLDPNQTSEPQPTLVRYDPRGGRFDITFDFSKPSSSQPVRLRYTGTAIETIETAVLTRNLDRNDIIKTSDIAIERRPKSDLAIDAVGRDKAIGMQARRQLAAGQVLRGADLAKPDLVQRDQTVAIIYETPGLYLTTRGKAVENGSEGDVVNVMNLQSKRIVQGVVTGPSQITIAVPFQRSAQAEVTSSIALAANAASSTTVAP